MATLTEIYGTVPTDCYVDDSGVYLNNEKVALDNKANSGYIRWDGERRVERIGNAIYRVEKPLVFVGCAPRGDSTNLLRATIAALVGGVVDIQRATMDKKQIAELENIDLEEMRKFDGVAMVWIQYRETTTQVSNIPTPRGALTPEGVGGIFDDSFGPTFN